MHQFGWLSEGGVNVLKLLQKEGGAQKGGGGVNLGILVVTVDLCKVNFHISVIQDTGSCCVHTTGGFI